MVSAKLTIKHKKSLHVAIKYVFAVHLRVLERINVLVNLRICLHHVLLFVNVFKLIVDSDVFFFCHLERLFTRNEALDSFFMANLIKLLLFFGFCDVINLWIFLLKLFLLFFMIVFLIFL